MEIKTTGATVSSFNCGDILLYTKVIEDKYYLVDPLTLYYYQRIDGGEWHPVEAKLEYVVHKDGKTFISWQANNVMGMQCCLGVKLLKDSKAARVLYGNKEG